MTLAECDPGTRARVLSFRGAKADRLRLAELGFVRAADLWVIARGATGGLLVALGDARVAVDDRTAAALTVTPAAAVTRAA